MVFCAMTEGSTMCLPSALTETYEGRSCNSQMWIERS